MPKYLVIVESPNKVGKIKSFLGKDYEVCASVGHIRDLPAKGLNVDVKNNFEPKYGTIPGKGDVIKNIKAKAKKADLIYIMTDEDREGEGIAHHIASILPSGKDFKRAVTNSITKSAVLSAIANASNINHAMVDSYETRRILDRLCGYKTSFPTQQATGGKSAGRVQSAALRIIAEREKEINAFVPQEYWPIEVELERDDGERVKATIKVPKPLDIPNEIEANTICNILKKEKWKVSKYDTKEKMTKPYAPFTTSTMYQSASSIFGWGSKKSAQIAQSLYENGSITYIRTDSTHIVPEFISSIRDTVPNKYGSDYLPSKSNVYSSKKNAQEAHEAVRVTDLNVESVAGADQQKLYKIIWKRTVASQMEKMRQRVGSAEFQCDKYIFGATGSKVLFDGFKKCWNYGLSEDNELPEFEVGEELKCISVKTEQKFTSPPPHYTESSIVKELEKRGIGRPSTFASIPATLLARKYIEKKKNTLYATEMGIRVSDFLVETDFCFVNLSFTSDLETKLDEIAQEEADKVEVLTEFWERLSGDLSRAKSIKEDKAKTDYPCPRCGEGFLVKKFSKYGPFYSCSNRSNKENKCDYKCQIGENGEPYEKPKVELEESEFVCPNCGEALLKRTSKKGWEYLGCKNWNQSEDCKGFYDKDSGEEIVFEKKKKWKKWEKKKG